MPVVGLRLARRMVCVVLEGESEVPRRSPGARCTCPILSSRPFPAREVTEAYFPPVFEPAQSTQSLFPAKTETLFAPRAVRMSISSGRLAIHVPFWHRLGISRGTPRLDP